MFHLFSLIGIGFGILIFFFILFKYFQVQFISKKDEVEFHHDNFFKFEEIIDELSSISLKESNKKVKQDMISIFNRKIRGKQLPKFHFVHEEGHWLESQFLVNRNCGNSPDYAGFEIKKEANKITFGDWSPDEYIFKQSHIIPSYNYSIPSITRETFLQVFGKKSEKNDNRFSWSGLCVPKINRFNDYGQVLIFDKQDNLYALYSSMFDKYVKNKPRWVTYQPRIILAYWSREKLASHVSKKFNQRGFVICKKKNGKYNQICFGKPITFDVWLNGVKNGLIFFDSGMYEGNDRNYSQWRASSLFWETLIEEYF